jgi:hypothetical protein
MPASPCNDSHTLKLEMNGNQEQTANTGEHSEPGGATQAGPGHTIPTTEHVKKNRAMV